MTAPAQAPGPTAQPQWDAIIVGGGLAGLYALHKLRSMGFAARVFEAGPDIGGTWFWNRYPGARCDIESLEYSYQFSEELQQEWNWTERYASQPEILAYIHHVAERFDLRPGVELNTRIRDARFEESEEQWALTTDAGKELRGRFCILATGCLSMRNTPEWPGAELFEGTTYHTADWPEGGVDFSGQRVGVIGTGSSAIQSIPLIAKRASRLTVFQRTAGYTIPAHNVPLTEEVIADRKSEYAEFRKRNWHSHFGMLADFESCGPSALEAKPAERTAAFEEAWQTGSSSIFLNVYDDLMVDPKANALMADFVHQKIRDAVKNPNVAKTLTPEQTFGCKRLCLDTDYYDTFNRPNVDLVSIASNPISALTKTGLSLEDGTEFDLDAVVFATGFDAMTGALLAIDPIGRGGLRLSERWAEGPKAYLGLAVAGFPNLFTVTGPGSPSVLANMVPAIEQHVNWIAECLEHLRERGYRKIEAELPAQEAWADHVNEVADQTLFPQCNSWYVGSNIEGKTRVFMPYIGFGPYVEKCEQVAAAGYEGFALS